MPHIVLLVDDDEIVRRSLKRCLRNCGAEIREAADGAEALELLRGGLSPAIVISDVDMPKLNGLKLAIHIKEEFPSIPVVVCSGGDHQQTAEMLGVRYLAKPADPSTIRDIVAKVL
jgi:CheY-like chemotaxis protein